MNIKREEVLDANFLKKLIEKNVASQHASQNQPASHVKFASRQNSISSISASSNDGSWGTTWMSSTRPGTAITLKEEFQDEDLDVENGYVDMGYQDMIEAENMYNYHLPYVTYMDEEIKTVPVDPPKIERVTRSTQTSEEDVMKAISIKDLIWRVLCHLILGLFIGLAFQKENMFRPKLKSYLDLTGFGFVTTKAPKDPYILALISIIIESSILETYSGAYSIRKVSFHLYADFAAKIIIRLLLIVISYFSIYGLHTVKTITFWVFFFSMGLLSAVCILQGWFLGRALKSHPNLGFDVTFVVVIVEIMFVNFPLWM